MMTKHKFDPAKINNLLEQTDNNKLHKGDHTRQLGLNEPLVPLMYCFGELFKNKTLYPNLEIECKRASQPFFFNELFDVREYDKRGVDHLELTSGDRSLTFTSKDAAPTFTSSEFLENQLNKQIYHEQKTIPSVEGYDNMTSSITALSQFLIDSVTASSDPILSQLEDMKYLPAFRSTKFNILANESDIDATKPLDFYLVENDVTLGLGSYTLDQKVIVLQDDKPIFESKTQCLLSPDEAFLASIIPKQPIQDNVEISSCTSIVYKQSNCGNLNKKIIFDVGAGGVSAKNKLKEYSDAGYTIVGIDKTSMPYLGDNFNGCFIKMGIGEKDYMKYIDCALDQMKKRGIIDSTFALDGLIYDLAFSKGIGAPAIYHVDLNQFTDDMRDDLSDSQLEKISVNNAKIEQWADLNYNHAFDLVKKYGLTNLQFNSALVPMFEGKFDVYGDMAGVKTLIPTKAKEFKKTYDNPLHISMVYGGFFQSPSSVAIIAAKNMAITRANRKSDEPMPLIDFIEGVNSICEMEKNLFGSSRLTTGPDMGRAGLMAYQDKMSYIVAIGGKLYSPNDINKLDIPNEYKDFLNLAI